MDLDGYCRDVIEKYPEYVSKEQMYKICHIKKSTCLFLLENKLVPCIDNGKPTHRFKVRTADIVNYLQEKAIHPEKYKALSKPTKRKTCQIIFTDTVRSQLRLYYSRMLEGKPNILDAFIVARFTGYEITTAERWCAKGKVKCFKIRNKFVIPKEYLLDFLISDYYISIHQKSRKHMQQMKCFSKEFNDSRPEPSADY